MNCYVCVVLYRCCCFYFISWSLVHLTVRSFVAWNIYLYTYTLYRYTHTCISIYIFTTCFDRSNGSLLFIQSPLSLSLSCLLLFILLIIIHFEPLSFSISIFSLLSLSQLCIRYFVSKFKVADHAGLCCSLSYFLLLGSRLTIVLFIPIHVLFIHTN